MKIPPNVSTILENHFPSRIPRNCNACDELRLHADMKISARFSPFCYLCCLLSFMIIAIQSINYPFQERVEFAQRRPIIKHGVVLIYRAANPFYAIPRRLNGGKFWSATRMESEQRTVLYLQISARRCGASLCENFPWMSEDGDAECAKETGTLTSGLHFDYGFSVARGHRAATGGAPIYYIIVPASERDVRYITQKTGRAEITGSLHDM
jgi:hypothetical protein